MIAQLLYGQREGLFTSGGQDAVATFTKEGIGFDLSYYPYRRR